MQIDEINTSFSEEEKHHRKSFFLITLAVQMLPDVVQDNPSLPLSPYFIIFFSFSKCYTHVFRVVKTLCFDYLFA